MLIGKRINDRYKILQLIGGGGMSQVYLAEDIILNREVAIKILRYDFTQEEELHRRFQREAQAATSLTHPNIVSIYDVGDDGDYHFIVMEHVKGQTLKQYIQQFAPIAPAKAVQIMKQLTSAIAHAHEHRIIHRDIKPQNILMDFDGNVKVTDFGIATTLSATSYTKTNSVIGTVHYLSPEQARGGIATHKSDIYALGIVLYEMLTGELPFSGESAVSIALKHLQSETPSVREINASIPQSLENVVLKATAKNPDHRYETVEMMEKDLETVLSVSRMNEPKYEVPVDEDKTKLIPVIKEPAKPAAEKIELKAEVTVPNNALPEKKKKKWPIVVGSMIFAIVVLALLYIFLKPSKIEVPDLTNVSLEEAEEQLEKLGFVVGEVTEENDDEIEEGYVIETNPKAGLLKVKGTKIDLVVSLGKEKIEIDDFVGSKIEQVQSLLADFKEVIIEEVHSKEPVGQILEQQPEPGEKIVPEETNVTLKVSKGEKMVTVIDLTKYTEQALKVYEQSSGLIVKVVGEKFSDTIPQGQVISQSPVAGKEIAEGGTVEVVLSKGPEEKKVKVYVQDITIPYEPTEEGEEQIVRIYIEDRKHSLVDLYEEIKITEAKTYRISLEIEEGSKAAYQVTRDNKIIFSQTISYDSIAE